MSKLEHFKTLLNDFGRAIGLRIQVDNEGYSCLAFDQKIVVHLQYNERTGNVVFFSELGTVTDYDKDAVSAQLLKANVFFASTSGGTLGLNPKTQMVTLGLQVPIVNFNQESFQKTLKNFVDTAEKWIKNLEDIRHNNTVPAVYHAESYSAEALGDMIQV